jgi:hypothetical protein
MVSCCDVAKQFCSATECGSSSQVATWSFGTTSFRQVSASVGIVRRSGDCLSASTCAALPVNRSSCASVGGPVLRRWPAWLGKANARHHRRESYSKPAQAQSKNGGNRAVMPVCRTCRRAAVHRATYPRPMRASPSGWRGHVRAKHQACGASRPAGARPTRGAGRACF